MNYLDHFICPGSVEVLTRISNVIWTLKHPTNVTERLLLGSYNVHRRFGLMSIHVAALLSRKLQDGQLQIFYRLAADGFNALERLTAEWVKPLSKTLPRLQGDHTVHTDAFDKQLGFVVLWKHPEGTDKAIRFWSRSLNDAERAYVTAHSKCRAVLWAVPLRQAYMEGCWFTVCLDVLDLNWS